MTSTAAAASSALAPLVDVLVAEPLDGVDVPGLQAPVQVVSAQVSRLQGWLTAAAGQLQARTGGSVPDADTGRARTVAGWLAQVQRSTASASRGSRASITPARTSARPPGVLSPAGRVLAVVADPPAHPIDVADAADLVAGAVPGLGEPESREAAPGATPDDVVRAASGSCTAVRRDSPTGVDRYARQAYTGGRRDEASAGWGAG